jgi:ribose 5-phosphate isomerase RpiB
LDFGKDSKNSVNYNEIAEKMILKLQEDLPKDQIFEIENFGILICGTKMSILANKFHRIRACNAIN